MDNELQPTLAVYLAVVGLTQINLQTPEDVERFITDALVLLPQYTRAELLAMDFGALMLLTRERIAAVSVLFLQRADETQAVMHVEDLLDA